MKIFSFPSLESTQKTAYDMMQHYHAFVVHAYEQTAGIGTHNRKWHSPIGNFYATYGFKIQSPLQDMSFALCVCIVIHRTLKILNIDKNIQYKWPNDLFLDSQKCGGILIETFHIKGAYYILIGIGLNITTLPSLENSYAVTTLLKQDEIFPIHDFLSLLGTEIEKELDLFIKLGFSSLKDIWLKHALYLNEPVILRTPKEDVKGIFHDINNYGHIGIMNMNKQCQYYVSGTLRKQ